MIDTQAPLPLSSSKYLTSCRTPVIAVTRMLLALLGGQLVVLDLLSVHLIRNTEGSTMISYHPSLPLPTTTAKSLHRRIQLTGTPSLMISCRERSPID